MGCYHTMTEPLLNGLTNLTEKRIAEPAPFSPTGNAEETVGSLLATFVFHEA